MRIGERYQLAAELRERYWAAGRRERGQLLDAFCLATGYNRKYATSLLRGRRRKPRVLRRVRRKRYGKAFQSALAVVWEASGYICAERLQPFLGDLLALLEAHDQLNPESETKALLLSASISTIERNLVALRRSPHWHRRRLRLTTRLQREVPIRVRNWRQQGRPGFLEIDLVSHSGPWPAGDWIYTLSATDLETGWTELVPVLTKGKYEILSGFTRIRDQLPFPLLGVHIDNGFEFLNETLVGYCRRHRIALSRGRPFHKNDNPHVEQKNGYLVRRLVGNLRLDSADQLAWLDRLYTELLRPFNNCFQPVMHKVGQVQVGDHLRRLHDTPKTPLQRLIETDAAKPHRIQDLVSLYSSVSPLTLKRSIDRHLKAMPADHYSVPSQRYLVAAGG
jgi:hypothetical protein